MRALVLAAACLFPGTVLAAGILGARYDAGADQLVVDIAYRGTHPGHEYTLEWGPCRREDGPPHAVLARLVDRQGDDTAREDFRVRERFSLAGLPCRPARVTLRLGRVSHASVIVPRHAEAANRPAPGTVAGSPVDWQNMRASELLGRELLSDRGEALGHVVELLIDLGAGRVEYAVLELSVEGGVRRVRTPVEALSPGRHGQAVWRPAPGGAASAGASAAAPEGELFGARHLVGRDVRTPEGGLAGRVSDLVVNLDSGEVRRVALDLGPQELLVPLHALQRGELSRGEPLVLLAQP